jgi:hypothetical protein
MTKSRPCIEVGCPNTLTSTDGHSLCPSCLDDTHFLPRDQVQCEYCLAIKTKSYQKRLHNRASLALGQDSVSVTHSEGHTRKRHRSPSPVPQFRRPLKLLSNVGLGPAPYVTKKSGIPPTSTFTPSSSAAEMGHATFLDKTAPTVLCLYGA